MSEAQKVGLCRSEAAEYLKSKHGINRQPGTLAKLASLGTGPKFYKVGRKPIYPTIELDSWADSITTPLTSSSRPIA